MRVEECKFILLRIYKDSFTMLCKEIFVNFARVKNRCIIKEN